MANSTPTSNTMLTATKQWVDHRLPVLGVFEHLNHYPTPKNLNYFWNFGSLAGITLAVMILTGFFLVLVGYTPNTDQAFASVERIMRDVNGGWLIRYIHMNGASIFFMMVYIHIFRGLYYGSYKNPRELLWILGVLILLLMMATAFMGYVLPWGQMSLWGAEVITGFASAVPIIGEDLQTFARGAFAVENATLTRFFALHFVLPFAIVGVVMLHIVALHKHGSNNPLGIDLKQVENIPFHPYYTVKDLYGLGLYLILFAGLVFFAPNYLGHADNYIEANPLQTPPHIVPEWYFLPFYAILRGVEFTDILGFSSIFGYSFVEIIDFFSFGYLNSKLGGVVAMGAAVLILFIVPWLDRHKTRSASYRPIYKWLFWAFFVNAIMLGYLGTMDPESDFQRGFAIFGYDLFTLYLPIKVLYLCQLCGVFYFMFFLVFMPLLTYFEPEKKLPFSIADSIDKESK